MLVRGSNVALLPQCSKQLVLPLQGEEHGHCSLKGNVRLRFFFFLSSDQEGKNYWVTLYLKGEVSFQIFLGRWFVGVGGCCFHCQSNCSA